LAKRTAEYLLLLRIEAGDILAEFCHDRNRDRP
jgi:hypothetical protein